MKTVLSKLPPWRNALLISVVLMVQLLDVARRRTILLVLFSNREGVTLNITHFFETSGC